MAKRAKAHAPRNASYWVMMTGVTVFALVVLIVIISAI